MRLISYKPQEEQALRRAEASIFLRREALRRAEASFFPKVHLRYTLWYIRLPPMVHPVVYTPPSHGTPLLVHLPARYTTVGTPPCPVHLMVYNLVYAGIPQGV